MEVTCPSCGVVFDSPEVRPGEAVEVSCPICGTSFEVALQSRIIMKSPTMAASSVSQSVSNAEAAQKKKEDEALARKAEEERAAREREAEERRRREEEERRRREEEERIKREVEDAARKRREEEAERRRQEEEKFRRELEETERKRRHEEERKRKEVEEARKKEEEELIRRQDELKRLAKMKEEELAALTKQADEAKRKIEEELLKMANAPTLPVTEPQKKADDAISALEDILQQKEQKPEDGESRKRTQTSKLSEIIAAPDIKTLKPAEPKIEQTPKAEPPKPSVQILMPEGSEPPPAPPAAAASQRVSSLKEPPKEFPKEQPKEPAKHDSSKKLPAAKEPPKPIPAKQEPVKLTAQSAKLEPLKQGKPEPQKDSKPAAPPVSAQKVEPRTPDVSKGKGGRESSIVKPPQWNPPRAPTDKVRSTTEEVLLGTGSVSGSISEEKHFFSEEAVAKVIAESKPPDFSDLDDKEARAQHKKHMTKLLLIIGVIVVMAAAAIIILMQTMEKKDQAKKEHKTASQLIGAQPSGEGEEEKLNLAEDEPTVDLGAKNNGANGVKEQPKEQKEQPKEEPKKEETKKDESKEPAEKKEKTEDKKDNAKKEIDFIMEGSKMLSSGKYEEAIVKFKEAIKMNPKNPNAYKGLGAANAFLKRNNEAVSNYCKCLQLGYAGQDLAQLKAMVEGQCK